MNNLKCVVFYKATDILSQWYRCSFCDKDGVVYNSAEQYMMAQKALLFNDDIYSEIMVEEDMQSIKNLGKKVKNFQQIIWDEKKEDVVYDANYLKFSQNESLKEYLLSTCRDTIIEANPNDIIWATGLCSTDKNLCNPSKWRGENLLGLILEKVRDELRLV